MICNNIIKKYNYYFEKMASLSSLRGHFLLLMYPPPNIELMGTLFADLYQVVPFSSAKLSNQTFVCVTR